MTTANRLGQDAQPSAPALSAAISQITDYLYIAANPRSDVAELIEAAGVRLVISMIAIRPSLRYFRHPFRIFVLPTADHPRLPIPLFVLRRGVKAALPVIEQGDAVLVYCREGRHRSVAMACCILIAMGMTADEAMALVMAKRPVADPHATHIESQIRAFARTWSPS